MFTRGEVGKGWVIEVIRIKECTCREEYQVLYGCAESLYCTTATNYTVINKLWYIHTMKIYAAI